MSSQSPTTLLHINLTHLPVNQRNSLCAVLDQNEGWMELGAFMQFSDFEILVSFYKLIQYESFS